MGDPVVNVKQDSENAALVAALEQYGTAQIVRVETPDGESSVEVVASSDGSGKASLKSVKAFLDEYRTAPERREGTATLTTLASFCDHVKRFMDDHSVIFADVENRKDAKLIAVIDYHMKTFAGAPRFGKHRGVYQFPLSEEWKAWDKVDGKEMDQRAFAQHIEDRILDIMPPAEAGKFVQDFAANLGGSLASAQRMKELADGISIRVDTAVTNTQNLSTGEGQINFQETHGAEGGGPLKVPKGFAIGIPVFKGGDVYSMPVRLRYRKHENKILWMFLLYRSDRVWDDAIKIACDFAHAETGRQLLYGRPEI